MSPSSYVTTLLVIGVGLFQPARATPFQGGFQQWLQNLRTIVNQNVTCFFIRGPHDVQLSTSYETDWIAKAPSSENWKDYTSTNVKGLELPVHIGGVMISSFNAHLMGTGDFHARLTFDGASPFPNDVGTFYRFTTTSEHWCPFNFVQMKNIACGSLSHNVLVRLQTKSPEWRLNGAGHSAVLLPPPAFLSSVQSPLISGTASESPYKNLVHRFEVSSQKALLLMAANGRIRGTDGETSLTFTVNGYSPTGQHGRDYGFYRVTAQRTGQSPIHMGLYQLAEVGSGSHIVQLEGKGSDFELQNATSQVTCIPVDTVQLKTVTAAWAPTVNNSRTILSTSIVAIEDSLLFLTSTFEVGSECAQYNTFVRFNVDGKSPVWPRKNSGTLDAFHFNAKTNEPYPGSLLNFAKVTKGYHRVDLYTLKLVSCAPVVTRAVLQVGVIPQSF